MSAPRALLSAALAASLLFAPGAEARFGKRTSSDSSKEESHEATAIGADEDKDDDDDDDEPSKAQDSQSSDSDGGGCCGGAASSLGEEILGSLFRVMLEGLVYVIATNGTHLDGEPNPDSEVSQSRRHAAPLSMRMGVQGVMPGEGASALDMYFGMEERRFGVAANVLRLELPTDDGTEGVDRLTLVEAHVSHAFYVHPRARVRAEAGVSTARAPDVTLVGPSVAVSVEACLLGPLDVEARAQLTPLPYRQVDGTAGLALHLGGFVLRGGWRGLFLDDLGVVDGISHQDRLHGPYLGAGFAF
ncbi:hypothetical protein [Pyxidicoccus caerfyrddinensis]|uniref:hypothetical protein n=1 Tax=Pyxidicoccus caerfyrddinensis TaxID=2709663 RepID=UPI0013D9AA0D|nr:hypothetical protein [Pyxidicoccus caerfyrddinensis]